MAPSETRGDALPDLCTEIDATLKTLTQRYVDSQSALGSSIRDVRERFEIWANNIGARQTSQSLTSLQYRVRDAPKLASFFLGRLKDLQEDLVDLTSALDETNRQESESALPVELISLSISGAALTEPDSISDVAELLKAASEDITALFGLSVIARKTSSRDRYARALQKIAPSDVLAEHLEVERVTHLYPTLRFPDFHWLKMRLANANNQRRRYLKYCGEHQRAIHQTSKVFESQPASSIELVDTMSIGAGTTASTVVDAVVESTPQQPQEYNGSDMQSFVSYDTQSFSNLVYEVPDLKDISGNSNIFICPYCRMEQSISEQQAWAKHVFADLKAYVCIKESCTLTMFETSHQWLAHELSAHLKIEQCPYCNTYDRSQVLRQHIAESHSDVIEHSQLSALLKTSKLELDSISVRACPFCDWHAKLSSISQASEKGRERRVSLQRYRRHICAHLEEVALCTITEPSTDADARSGATSDEGDHVDDTLDSLKSMFSLALTHQNHGRYGEAEELWVKVIDVSSKMLGEEHPETLNSKACLALTYGFQGRYEEAVDSWMKVIDASSRVLGSEHPDTLRSMTGLASIEHRQRRYREAEDLLVKIIDARTKVLGSYHLDTVSSISSLASVYRDEGRWPEVELLQTKILDALTKSQGSEHPDTMSSMASLALTYRRQGRFAEAEELQLKVVETLSRVLGQQNPQTLSALNELSRTRESLAKDWQAPESTGKSAALSVGSLSNSLPNTVVRSDKDTAPSTQVIENYQQPQQQNIFAPERASVPRYVFTDDKFRFIVECKFLNGVHWDLWRVYEDFYELQINLLSTFREEAGLMPPKPRILPYMPGPVTFVTDQISEQRCLDLDAYLRDLLRLERKITCSSLVRNFFAPREGDHEADPALNPASHARPRQETPTRGSVPASNEHDMSGDADASISGGMPRRRTDFRRDERTPKAQVGVPSEASM